MKEKVVRKEGKKVVWALKENGIRYGYVFCTWVVCCPSYPIVEKKKKKKKKKK
jgi:hypothetical protein